MLGVAIKTEPEFDNLAEKTFLQKRCDFFQRYQRLDETISTYLEVVRSLAVSCSFYESEEGLLIRDRLVSGLSDKNLQLKIIEAYENPSIEDVLKICIDGDDFVENEVKEDKQEMTVLRMIEDYEEAKDSSDNDFDRVDGNIKEEPTDQYLKSEGKEFYLKTK